MDAVLCGVNAFNSNVEDFGIITTPMLHFFVRCYNTNGLYGQPSEHSYYTKLTNSFKTLRKMASKLHTYLINRNIFAVLILFYYYYICALVFRFEKL